MLREGEKGVVRENRSRQKEIDRQEILEGSVKLQRMMRKGGRGEI